MDRLRNYAAANRSNIVNVIYIVAALVVVYYLAMFYLTKDDLDVTLLERPMLTNSNQKAYKLYDASTLKYKERRIKSGGEYTISAWMYINSWKGVYQPLFAVYDTSAGNVENREAIMMVALYPGEPKMHIRAGKINGATTPGTTVAQVSGATALGGGSMNNMPQCDLVDIDLQRWIFLTISVNGRIMDVYLDGKLARSCILPNSQNVAGEGTDQTIIISPSGLDASTMNGQISGVRFSAYAVAPDQIYAQYQSGPYTYVGFLDYLKSKLGFQIVYAGKTE